jgi:hypothetical protein
MRVGGGDDSANSSDALGGFGILAPQQSILKAKAICSFMEAYKLDIYIGSDNGSRKIDREYVDRITEWADRNFPEGYTLQSQISQQQRQIEFQQSEIISLKSLVCLDHPQAEQPLSQVVIPQLLHIIRPCNVDAPAPLQLYEPGFLQSPKIVEEATVPRLGLASVVFQLDNLGGGHRPVRLDYLEDLSGAFSDY